MSLMKISIYPKDKDREGKFLSYCIVLANERNVICQLKSKEAIVEGKKETILSILRELDKDLFDWSYRAVWPRKVLKLRV